MVKYLYIFIHIYTYLYLFILIYTYLYLFILIYTYLYLFILIYKLLYENIGHKLCISDISCVYLVGIYIYK